MYDISWIFPVFLNALQWENRSKWVCDVGEAGEYLLFSLLIELQFCLQSADGKRKLLKTTTELANRGWWRRGRGGADDWQTTN